MQVFMPTPNLEQNARILDPRRRNKQVVEIKQILAAIDLREKGVQGAWINHTVVRMYHKYPEFLRYYQMVLLNQQIWVNYALKLDEQEMMNQRRLVETPPFIGNRDLHENHMVNLLYKDYDWYKLQFNCPKITEPPRRLYIIDGKYVFKG